MQGQARESLIFTSAEVLGFPPRTAFCWLAQPRWGSHECGEPGSSSSSSCQGRLGPIGVLQVRGGDNEMENNFLAAGREHAGTGSSLPGRPLSETRLAKHTALLLLYKMGRCRCSITLDQVVTPSRLDTGERLMLWQGLCRLRPLPRFLGLASSWDQNTESWILASQHQLL